jgi:hypothetical protein
MQAPLGRALGNFVGMKNLKDKVYVEKNVE